VADARMFATLDPTVRQLTLPSRRRVLASDTVGFIRNLPTTLVKAFRATLEEVTEAALLLHVVDAGSPSAPQHTAHVFEVLADIGADQTQQILVLNKMDQMDAAAGDTESLTQRILGEVQAGARTQAVPVSARTGAGFDALLQAIDNALPLDPVSHQRFLIPAGEGSLIHLLHERARVLSSQYRDDVCELEAEVPESVKRRLSAYLVE
jgi:GTP-binding protein HflX